MEDLFQKKQDNWYIGMNPEESLLERIERETKAKNQLIEKTINCPYYKTLCWALDKLSAYEEKEGTEAFCDYVVGVDFNWSIKPVDLYLNHHYVVDPNPPNKRKIDYETKNDITLESSEFVSFGFPEMEYALFSINLGIDLTLPKLPVYIDIEYVEMGYALRKKYYAANGAYFAWNSLKAIIQLHPDIGGTNFGHIPNKYGFILGIYIADNYKDIRDFVNQWCVGGQCKL